jgi:predicted AAA+ superfamily ATPase
MFKRRILKSLAEWQHSKTRKPLVLRGARQVGKTTVVQLFAREFSQFLALNLEVSEDRELFHKFPNVHDLVRALFFLKGGELANASTLIFIDEIQEAPEAFAMLRYFHEEYPQYAVIAAGSLLESLFDAQVQFPVGRVEYKVLRPFSFAEFLEALGETAALAEYETGAPAAYAHGTLMRLFHDYALVGGMPEVVERFVASRDLSQLRTVYDSLLLSYFDDIEKYAHTPAQASHLRHAIRASFYAAGSRIKFQGFGESSYSSREMGEALRTAEKALLLQLVYPTTSVKAPFLPDLKKSPRLQVLDTGLLNHFSGIQGELLGASDLSEHYKGRIAEHIVGQEILANQESLLHPLQFWVREKKESNAELDFLVQRGSACVPVEVKSGATGTLRSLHQFMELSGGKEAVRLYAGEAREDTVKTAGGHEFVLRSLPYYLAGRVGVEG